jgi:hypothetical protein
MVVQFSGIRFGAACSLRVAAIASVVLLVCPEGFAEEEKPGPCTEDAMIVFDASGSMSGNQTLGIPNSRARIDEVRAALAQVLPTATKHRRVGLVTYGPGPWNQCNVKLDFKPTPDAANIIMSRVNALVPAGKTPLTSLDGSKHNYTFTFPKGQLPPVRFFWSVTMYDLNTRLLVENPINRYSIGDRTEGLKYGDDGSLTINVQKDSPGKDKESNWLPAPNGPMSIIARMYGPEERILDGEYEFPGPVVVK